MEYKLKMEVGDPSKDGHNQSETVYFRSNKTSQQIKEAYVKSCELTGLVFQENQDILVDGQKIGWQHEEYTDRKICVEYESYEISELAKGILKTHGIDAEGYYGPEEFVDFFLCFVSLSLPGFEFKIDQDATETLNITIGYGLFE